MSSLSTMPSLNTSLHHTLFPSFLHLKSDGLWLYSFRSDVKKKDTVCRPNPATLTVTTVMCENGGQKESVSAFRYLRSGLKNDMAPSKKSCTHPSTKTSIKKKGIFTLYKKLCEQQGWGMLKTREGKKRELRYNEVSISSQSWHPWPHPQTRSRAHRRQQSHQP